MAQARHNLLSASPIFRLDNPDLLDVAAINAAASKSTRGAWHHLVSVFEQASMQHCQQFSIEPDATLWRIRFRCIEGYVENILSDPSELICALEALQIELWDENYHTLINRTARFTWESQPFNTAVTLRVVHTVKGDQLQFDLEPMTPMPPMLDELHLPTAQLGDLRARLALGHGMILVTSSEPHLLDDTLLAINQALIAPDRKLLSISEKHRFSLPRTTQVTLEGIPENRQADSWKNALNSFHDTLLINACVPEQFHERLANACDQGVMAIHAIQVARAADSLELLNASVIRRSPLHRSVSTVINHFSVNGLCQQCSCKATLNADEQHWLEQSRTPVTENVISWLADGNTEQFMSAKGCDACNGTGNSAPLSVYDIVYRDDKTHQFPTAKNTSGVHRPKPMQRQLMTLAKTGKITLSEGLRVLALAG